MMTLVVAEVVSGAVFVALLATIMICVPAGASKETRRAATSRLVWFLPGLGLSLTFVPLWFGLVMSDLLLGTLLVISRGQSARLFSEDIIVEDGTTRSAPIDQKRIVVACVVFIVIGTVLAVVTGVGE